MAVLASDNFDRSDSTNLGSNWTEVEGDWAIESGVLRKVSNFGSYQIVTWDAPLNATPGADYEVEAECGVEGFDFGEPAVLGRVQNANTFYAVNVNLFGNAFQLFKLVGGSFTLLDVYNVTLEPNTTYKIKLSMVGSELKGYLNDVERVSAIDTSITTTGKPGLQSDLDGALWHDNFVVYGETASSSDIKTVNGIALASIKSINGIALADIKSINGINN